MFDLRCYTILLNEMFDTGHDNDDLYSLLESILTSEDEPVRPVNIKSSELHRILNNNRVMHAFTRVMAGKVRLRACYRQHVTQLGCVDFVLLGMPRGAVLGIRFDGVVACAVNSEREGDSATPEIRLTN